MAAYVAMEPPDGNPEKTVFVRDGFTFLAFVVPVLWFLSHRMWIEAALALALTLALGSLDVLGGYGGPAVSLLAALLIGLEAPALRLWALRRRGWRERGVVEARDLPDAELRLFPSLEDERAREEASPAPLFDRPAAQPALPDGGLV